MTNLKLAGTYTVSCLRNGREIWSHKIKNGITTVGKNNLLDSYLSGNSYSADFYLGLIDDTGSTFSSSDTSASHPGWVENTSYDEATRPSVTWVLASSASKTSNSLVFTINNAFVLQGCFLSTSPTKGGTTGILFSSGAFSGGNREVDTPDILSVTYTLSC